MISWRDNFNDSSLDTNKFTSVVSGSGVVTEASDLLSITSPAAADASLVYFNSHIIESGKYQVFSIKARYNVTSSNLNAFVVWNGHPTAGTTTSEKIGVTVGASGFAVYYINTSGTYMYWTGSAWSTLTYITPFNNDRFYTINFLVAPGKWKYQIVAEGGCRNILETDWVNFSAVNSHTADSMHIFTGDYFTNYSAGTVNAEWADYQEDTTRIRAYFNGQNTNTSVGQRIGEAYSLDNKRFFRWSRDAIITPDTGYTYAAWPYVVKLSSTEVYMFYCQYYTSTGSWRLFYRYSSNGGDTWGAQTLILQESGVGWRNKGVGFPIVYKDSSTWRIYLTGFDASFINTIGYFYGIDLASLSEGSNPIINKGGVGSWTESGVLPSDMSYNGSTITIWAAGLNSASRYQTGFWTSSCWDSGFTPDTGNPIEARQTSRAKLLSAGASAGATTITLNDASAFTAGMPIWIAKATGSSALEGEGNRIVSIATNTLTLEQPLLNAYLANDLVNSYDSQSIQFNNAGNRINDALATSFHLCGTSAQLETLSYWQKTGGIWGIDHVYTPTLPLSSTGNFDHTSAENLSSGISITPIVKNNAVLFSQNF